MGKDIEYSKDEVLRLIPYCYNNAGSASLFGDVYVLVQRLHESFGGTIAFDKTNLKPVWVSDNGTAFCEKGIYRSSAYGNLVPINLVTQEYINLRRYASTNYAIYKERLITFKNILVYEKSNNAIERQIRFTENAISLFERQCQNIALQDDMLTELRDLADELVIDLNTYPANDLRYLNQYTVPSEVNEGDEFYISKRLLNDRVTELKKSVTGADSKVLEFIAMFTAKGGNEFASKFTQGLCYYFASLLEKEFGGEIMFVKLGGHIVWVDKNDIAYDAFGVFFDYKDGDLMPIELMSEVELNCFKHLGYYDVKEECAGRLETLRNIAEYEKTARTDCSEQIKQEQINHTNRCLKVLSDGVNGNMTMRDIDRAIANSYQLMSDVLHGYMESDATSLF